MENQTLIEAYNLVINDLTEILEHPSPNRSSSHDATFKDAIDLLAGRRDGLSALDRLGG